MINVIYMIYDLRLLRVCRWCRCSIILSRQLFIRGVNFFRHAHHFPFSRVLAISNPCWRWKKNANTLSSIEKQTTAAVRWPKATQPSRVDEKIRLEKKKKMVQKETAFAFSILLSGWHYFCWVGSLGWNVMFDGFTTIAIYMLFHTIPHVMDYPP